MEENDDFVRKKFGENSDNTDEIYTTALLDKERLSRRTTNYGRIIFFLFSQALLLCLPD